MTDHRDRLALLIFDALDLIDEFPQDMLIRMRGAAKQLTTFEPGCGLEYVALVAAVIMRQHVAYVHAPESIM